ncbi:hypothetical protein ACLB2K_004510 [Fragaria x ananassa]
MEINKSKKKRKSSAGNDKLEKTEEAEMQIFFALVDNIREAGLRLMNGSNVVLNAAGIDQTDDYRSNKKKKKKKLIEEEEQMFRNAAVWNPSLVFQHQDLREESRSV